jgi:hypothetical protein
LYPHRPKLSDIDPAGCLAAVKAPVVQADDIAYFHIPAHSVALPEGVIQGFLAGPLLHKFFRLMVILGPLWRAWLIC